MKGTKKRANKNKNIFGRNFKKLFLLVVAVIIVVGIAQYTVQFIPGSSAQIPLPSPYAALGKEFRVTTEGAWKADVYENNVVYNKVDRASGYESAIVLRNMKEGWEKTISDAPGEQLQPAIYGTKVVWQDRRRSGYIDADIYMSDIIQGGEKKISLDEWTNNYTPDIYGNRVVWVASGGSAGNASIVSYAIDTQQTTVISRTSYVGDVIPSIYNNIVVWEELTNTYDVYMYDFNTGAKLRIAGNPILNERNPVVYENKIIFVESDTSMSPRSKTMKMYNVLTQNTETVMQVDYPALIRNWGIEIYGNKIVWLEHVFVSSHLLAINVNLYDLVTKKNAILKHLEAVFQPPEPLDLWQPNIYDKNIVWSDNRDIDVAGVRSYNVFMFTLLR